MVGVHCHLDQLERDYRGGFPALRQTRRAKQKQLARATCELGSDMNSAPYVLEGGRQVGKLLSDRTAVE